MSISKEIDRVKNYVSVDVMFLPWHNVTKAGRICAVDMMTDDISIKGIDRVTFDRSEYT